MTVSKNTIARLSLKESSYDQLAQHVQGQMALILSNSDAAEVSKILIKFAKSYEGFAVEGGCLSGVFLNPQDIKRLSDLPSREVLLAQLLGTMQAPLTRFAGALNGKTRELISLLKQLSDRT